jgi:hypothetical protein
LLPNNKEACFRDYPFTALGAQQPQRLAASRLLRPCLKERDSTGLRSPEGLLDFCFLPEVAAKQLASQTRHFVQGSLLLKQMGCARDNLQMFFRFEFFISLPIKFDDRVAETADDEQGG